MRSLSTLICLLFLSMPLLAQPTNAKGWYDSKDIENVEMGWMSVMQFKEAAKPFSKNGWTYPVTQIDFSRTIVSWWQESYLPKGLLGEMRLSVLAPDPALPISNSSYDFNEAEKSNRLALPNTYGAYARLHKCVVKTATHKFWPMSGNLCYVNWNIMANNVELISKQLVYLSSADEYYCIQPRYTQGMKGADKEWTPKYANFGNFTNSPNLKKYDHYYVPGQQLGSDGGFYVVIMTKDGKPLPFEQVTIGEFLNRLEKRLPMMYAIQKNSVKLENLLGKAQNGLRILKDQFKNQLGDYVYLKDINNNIDCLTLSSIEENKPVYWLKTQATTQTSTGWTDTNFPLLRLKKGVKEACATTGPQWIIFRLDASLEHTYAGEADLMENFVSRFNYDYVYNYFFGKDKVVATYKATEK